MSKQKTKIEYEVYLRYGDEDNFFVDVREDIVSLDGKPICEEYIEGFIHDDYEESTTHYLKLIKKYEEMSLKTTSQVCAWNEVEEDCSLGYDDRLQIGLSRMKAPTIDPTNITDFNRDTNQLQAFWLFCMFVAGKNSNYASRCLTKLIHAAKLGEEGIFDYFKSIGETGIHNALVANRIGQYTRLTKGIMQSLELDLSTCTLEDLLDIHGVGNKTARFFLLHTRVGCDYAVLDTHILAWLRDHGIHNAPKNTPTNTKLYRELEKQFRYLSRLQYPFLTDAQIDLLVWSDQSGRISGEEVFDMTYPFESRDGVDD